MLKRKKVTKKIIRRKNSEFLHGGFRESDRNKITVGIHPYSESPSDLPPVFEIPVTTEISIYSGHIPYEVDYFEDENFIEYLRRRGWNKKMAKEDPKMFERVFSQELKKLKPEVKVFRVTFDDFADLTWIKGAHGKKEILDELNIPYIPDDNEGTFKEKDYIDPKVVQWDYVNRGKPNSDIRDFNWVLYSPPVPKLGEDMGYNLFTNKGGEFSISFAPWQKSKSHPPTINGLFKP